MGKFADAIHALCVSAWAGAVWSMGLLVLPLLRSTALPAAVVHSIQARLLLFVALIGIACATYLLLFRLTRFGAHALRQAFFWVTLILVVLVVATQFGASDLLRAAQPHAALHGWLEALWRDRSVTWFGLPSVLYLVQCVLAAALVLLQQGVPR